MTISPVIPVYNRSPIMFERGEGVYLYTKSGERYLDFLSGIAVNALGHSHPHLLEALKIQADKLWHLSNVFPNEPLIKLSERLVELTFADSVFFCNSGTEAVECGIKAVRKYFSDAGKPEKHRIITFDGAFHGRTFGAMAATGSDKILDGFEPRLPGFDKVAINLDAVKAAITANTAAILVEPIQGEGGIMPLPHEFLCTLRVICDENDLLLFLDEVQCGVGRTGKLFAYQNCCVEPDIMSIAKGIGGGFPLGACLMVEKVAKALKVGSHGTTFGGNPLATAVGNAVLDIVAEEKFLAHVREVSEYFGAELQKICDEFPEIVEEVRGVGLMRGLKVKDPLLNTDLLLKLRDNYLVVNAAGQNVIRFLPPLIIEKSHVDEAMAMVRKTFSTL
jgi:acetylornithine/N-succinyldiaminopimelate aminotransferase